MENVLVNQLKDLKELDIQRKLWLMLSALVILVLGFLIVDSLYLEEHNLLWTVGALGITLSVVWWYWAMRLINKLITHRVEEVEVLEDLCVSIKEIKEDIKKI